MPPWSSSAGPSLSELWWSVAISWPRPDLHSGTGMMSWILKHYCPRVRFMVKVWSFLCMLSSRQDCRIAPGSSLSAPVDVCAELMRLLDWKTQQTQRNNLTNTTQHTNTFKKCVKSASSYTIVYHIFEVILYGFEMATGGGQNTTNNSAVSWKPTQWLCSEYNICKGDTVTVLESVQLFCLFWGCSLYSGVLNYIVYWALLSLCVCLANTNYRNLMWDLEKRCAWWWSMPWSHIVVCTYSTY